MSDALTMALLCIAPGATQVPIDFHASGADVSVSVNASDGDSIDVVAFGAPLIEGLNVKDGAVHFRVPEIHSRTVLDLLNHRRADVITGQVVAYPPNLHVWGDAKIEVCTLGTPPWFVQWANAMGMAQTQFLSADALRRSTAKHDHQRIIVLGRESGIDHPNECIEVARMCAANVVVLEANWYEKRVRKAVALQDLELENPLKNLGKWTWRDLPGFESVWRPSLFWMNRTVVANDSENVLIEIFMQPDDSQVMVASFVPWEEQVGRSDTADAFLATLLLESSRAKAPESFDGRLRIHAGDRSWPDEQRPVLSRASSASILAPDSQTVHVVDVRGDLRNGLTAGRINGLQRSAKGEFVLLLGDDSILRDVRRLPKPNVIPTKQSTTIWLDADNLPPKPADQEALMRVLTAFRIPLNSTLEQNP